MTPDTKTPSPPSARPEPAVEDLSQAIAQAVETQADEQASVVRVFDDHYRCNWWVREKAAQWLSITTGTIRRSKFLRATKTANGLLIEELSGRR